MSTVRTAFLESAVQSGSVMAARLSVLLATFVVGYFEPMTAVIQFDSFVIASTFVALGLGLGFDSGLSLVAAEVRIDQRHLMLWVALAFPTLVMLPLALALCGAYFWLEPILLMWWQWGLAVVYGYLQVNLTIAYAFDRFSGSAIKVSLIILVVNLLGFFVGSFSLARGGGVSDFMIAYVLALSLGNLIVIPRQILRYPVPLNMLSEAPAALWNLVSFSIWYLISSLTLLLRRPIERATVIAVSSPEILGTYIIVSRIAELIGLLGSILSSGFMPIIIRQYRDPDGSGKALARHLLDGYFALTIGLVGVMAVILPIFSYVESLPYNREVLPSLFLLIVANSLLGVTSLSGQGFTLTRKGHYVGLSGALFVLAYAGFSFIFSYAGYGISSTPMGFLLASFIYAVLIVQGSEYLAPVGYSIWRQLCWMLALIGLAFCI